jgi:hypothetical protein
MSLFSKKGCTVRRQWVRFIIIPALTAFVFSLFLLTGTSWSAERASKKQAPKEKEVVVDDSNVQAQLSKAAEFLKKGNQDSALRISLKVNEYTKQVLATVSIVRTQYERLIADQTTPQAAKEDLIIKLQRINQLTAQYSVTRDTSGYYAGYILAGRGDTERARQYLSEVLASTPFSMERESLWMKSKTLLLGLYNLTGEF